MSFCFLAPLAHRVQPCLQQLLLWVVLSLLFLLLLLTFVLSVAFLAISAICYWVHLASGGRCTFAFV